MKIANCKFQIGLSLLLALTATSVLSAEEASAKDATPKKGPLVQITLRNGLQLAPCMLIGFHNGTLELLNTDDQVARQKADDVKQLQFIPPRDDRPRPIEDRAKFLRLKQKSDAGTLTSEEAQEFKRLQERLPASPFDLNKRRAAARQAKIASQRNGLEKYAEEQREKLKNATSESELLDGAILLIEAYREKGVAPQQVFDQLKDDVRTIKDPITRVKAVAALQEFQDFIRELKTPE